MPLIKRVQTNMTSDMTIFFTKELRWPDNTKEILEKSNKKKQDGWTKEAFLELTFEPSYEADDDMGKQKMTWTVGKFEKNYIQVLLTFTIPEKVSITREFDWVQVNVNPGDTMFFDKQWF